MGNPGDFNERRYAQRLSIKYPDSFLLVPGSNRDPKPGGLYGEVTPQNNTRQNSYRNPVIAEAMKSLGYVNRYGYGIQRAQKLLADNGNPPAEFSLEAGSVLVTIRRREI
jgi:hypothetical protein